MQPSSKDLLNQWKNEPGPAGKSSADTIAQWTKEGVESGKMEPQGFDKAMSVLGASSVGFLKGLSQVAGAPVDLVNLALDQVGMGSEDPVLGSKMINRAVLDFGDSMKDTLQVEDDFAIGEGKAEKVFGRIGEEVGGGFAWLVPFLGAAAKGAKGNVLTRGIIEPLAKAPARSTAAETAASLGSGAGAVVAEEIDPGNPYSEMAGQLAGGVAVAAPMAAATSVTKKVTDKLLPYSQASTKKDVAEILQNQAVDVDQAIKNLSDTGRRDLPEGFAPTSGQASQDPGLMNAEIAVSEMVPQSVRRRRFEQNQAISGVVEKTEPGGSAEDATDFFAGRISAINKSLDDKIQNADEAAKAAVSRLGNPNAEEASSVARQELETALKAARDTERALWKNIESDNVSIKDVKETAKTMVKDRLKSERADDFPDIARLLSQEPGKGGKKNKKILNDDEAIDEVLALRHRILDEIREESAGMAPNRNKVRRLNVLHESVMDALGKSGGGEGFDAARAYSKALNDKFTRGTVGRVLRLDRAGGSAIPEESTLPRLTASRPALQDLTKAVGGNESVDQAVSDFMVDKFKKETVRTDGKVSTQAARKWLQDNDFVLQEYPGARNSIKAAVLSSARGERVRKVAGREAARMQKSQASKWTNTDIDRSIEVAMSGNNRIKKIKSLMRSARRDPTGAAERGVKRAAWDSMMKRISGDSTDMAGTPFLRPNAMKKVLDQTDVLKALGYNEKEIKNLRSAYNATRLLTTQAKGGFLPGTSQTSEKMFTLNQLLSRAYGVQRGVVSARFVGSEIFTRFVNSKLQKLKQEDVQNLLTEAIMDPSTMEILLKTPTNKESAVKAAKSLNSLFANIGTTAAGLRDGGSE